MSSPASPGSAADAGRVINPMQCRGQVEGGAAQALGAALYEEMLIDEAGRVINPTFRNYHLRQATPSIDHKATTCRQFLANAAAMASIAAGTCSMSM
jgi:xanthine dehydrogenase molybdopterin-binding subunit B